MDLELQHLTLVAVVADLIQILDHSLLHQGDLVAVVLEEHMHPQEREEMARQAQVVAVVVVPEELVSLLMVVMVLLVLY